MKLLNFFFILLIMQPSISQAESEQNASKKSGEITSGSNISTKVPITIYYKNKKIKPKDFEEIYLLNKDKVILGMESVDQPFPVKRDKISQIIFNNSKEGKKGIVLKSGMVISGNVEEYDKDSSQWKIALFGQKGYVTLKGLDQIKSINLLETGLVVGGESRNPADAINVLEWIYDPENGQPFGKEGGYQMDIKKITLASNKIVVKADIYSEKSNILGKSCKIICGMRDNIGTSYKNIKHQWITIKPKSNKSTTSISCPKPVKEAKKIALYFSNDGGNRPGGHPVRAYCGYIDDNWANIPAINLELLK